MSTALARKYRLDVTADLTLSGGWLQLNGVTDFDPGIDPNTVDVTAYDTNGLPSFEVTAYNVAPTATFFRRLTGSVYDPGQEIVRLASSLQFGSAARCGFRWYDKTGGPETGQAIVIPSWKRASTGAKDAESVSVTLQATDGTVLLNFTNPGTASAAPVVLSASPAAQGSGKILTITGAGFLGTTAVSIGGTAASSFVVQSDNLITAVMPTAAAGSAPVIVTNAVGASAALAYTRGA